MMDDGIVVTSGAYNMRFSYLKVFGLEENEDDWEVHTSLPFNMKFV
jgi:hypothetical protein